MLIKSIFERNKKLQFIEGCYFSVLKTITRILYIFSIILWMISFYYHILFLIFSMPNIFIHIFSAAQEYKKVFLREFDDRRDDT